MAKDRVDKEKKREKKEKKRSESDGVHKSSKKEKKSKTISDAAEKELTTKVLEGLEKADAATNGDVEVNQTEEVEGRPVGALVPFANPLVEDKVAKKVLKSVKKGMLLISISLFKHGLMSTCRVTTLDSRSFPVYWTTLLCLPSTQLENRH